MLNEPTTKMYTAFTEDISCINNRNLKREIIELLPIY